MITVSKRKLFFLSFLVFFLSLYFAGPLLELKGVRPDLWVLLLLFYAFRVDWKKAPFFAFAIGLLKDVLSIRFFGIETFSLGVAAILLSYILGKVERDDPLIFIVSAFLFSLFYESLRSLGFALTSGAESRLLYFMARSFMTALYTVVFFPAAFLFFQHLADDRRMPRGAFR